MPIRTKPFLSVSAIAIVAPSFALADVTAVDVWDSWKDYADGIGYEVSVGGQSTSGNTLSLEDVRFAMPSPFFNGVVSLDLLELEDQSDGSVRITMSPDMPVSMSGTSETGESIDVAAILRQTGLELIASGNPDDISYDYTARQISVDFDKLILNGDAVEPVISAMVNGLNGSTAISSGDMWSMDSNARIDSIEFDMTFEDAGTRVALAAKVSDVVTTSIGNRPAEIDLQDPSWLLDAGVMNSGSVRFGPSSVVMEAEGDGAFNLAGSTQSSHLDFEMGNGVMSYSGGSRGDIYTISSPEMPFPPINLTLAESAFAFAGPLAPTDEPADFRLMLKLVELGIDEFLWQMFDPAGVLPHGPATIAIDTQGKARTSANLFDPEFAATGDAPEMELQELDINEFYVAIAGAEIDGRGSFTFDNSDMETFDGFPAPDGTVNFDIFGVNTLLDNLGAMGLLPQDQAMGARMMLGLFARPADGEDHMTSEIAVNPDGTVFANGQQLR